MPACTDINDRHSDAQREGGEPGNKKGRLVDAYEKEEDSMLKTEGEHAGRGWKNQKITQCEV